ncbi:MAG: protein kinase [Planctomycetes bacterium]|nr:protein kinase [Planctomycetota bacterium]
MKFKDLQITGTIKMEGFRSLHFGFYEVTRQEVVVEILDESIGAPPEVAQAFIEKAKKLSDIEHHVFSRILTYGSSDNKHYIAIEKIKGLRLVDLFNEKRKFAPQQAIGLIIDCAEVLHDVQAKGLFHGELRPSNIIVDKDGFLKIRNFFQFHNNKQHLLSLVSRRAEYISPEHIKFSDIGTKSDMYCLGILFHHLLCGHVPFSGSNPSDIWRAHLENGVPTVGDYVPHGARFDCLLQQMLSKKPGGRPESYRELIKELKELEKVLVVPTKGPLYESKPTDTARLDIQRKKMVDSKKASSSSTSNRHATSSRSSQSGRHSDRSSRPSSQSSRHSAYSSGGGKHKRKGAPPEKVNMTLILSVGAGLLILGIIIFLIVNGVPNL